MKLAQRYAALFILTLVVGCAGNLSVPVGPLFSNAAAQRAVFDAEGKYQVALIAANTYVNLPLCDKAKPPCATLSVVRQVQKAQPVARAALDAAESAVRTPGFGADVVNTAVTAGTSALSAFVTLTATLK